MSSELSFPLILPSDSGFRGDLSQSVGGVRADVSSVIREAGLPIDVTKSSTAPMVSTPTTGTPQARASRLPQAPDRPSRLCRTARPRQHSCHRWAASPSLVHKTPKKRTLRQRQSCGIFLEGKCSSVQPVPGEPRGRIGIVELRECLQGDGPVASRPQGAQETETPSRWGVSCGVPRSDARWSRLRPGLLEEPGNLSTE